MQPLNKTVLGLVGLGLLQVMSVAQAATITVDIVDDEDNVLQSNLPGNTFPLSKGCSLREALKTVFLNLGTVYDTKCGAATIDGPNTITFSKSLNIVSNSQVKDPTDQTQAALKRWGALPDISGNSGAKNGLTIDGGGNVVTLSCESGATANEAATRVFNVKIGAKATMSNIAIKDCSASGAGIGIFSTNSDLNLTNVSFTNNHSISGGTGGAVDFEGGALSMLNVNFTNNGTKDTAGATPNNASADGGALWLNGINNSLDGSNQLVVNPVNMTNVTFTNNTAEHNGGGMFVSSAGGSLGYTIQMTNVLFSLNTANGGLKADGATPNGEDGGGAMWVHTNNGDGAADLFLINSCQFLNNTATHGYGGAILLSNNSTLTFQDAGTPLPPLLSVLPTLQTPIGLIGGVVASNFSLNKAGGDPADADSPNTLNGSGGAIYSRGKLSVLLSSFIDNTSSHGSGGAIAFNGPGSVNTATLGNVTLNGNSAARNGGALAHVAGGLTLINDTVDGNDASATVPGDVGGGALWNNGSSGEVQVRNTILGRSDGSALKQQPKPAKVTAVTDNCTGAVPTDLGNNLQYAPNDSCGTITNGDPNLGAPVPLQGLLLFSLTMPIAGDHSPAQGTGDENTCDAGPILKFDGTGTPAIRPTGDPSCDIGAFESSTTFPVQLQSFNVD